MVGSVEDYIVIGGISIYWPFWLVCAVGVLLVLIAVFSLLMIKGKTEDTPSWQLSHKVSEKKREKQGPLTEIRFFRIRWEAHVSTAFLTPNQWCTIGSGKTADFCLTEEDPKLEKTHFRAFFNGSALLVLAADGEIFVNGVPTRNLGTVAVHSGDLIRAGSYEYRVIFS